jgi:hypothetical protein
LQERRAINALCAAHAVVAMQTLGAMAKLDEVGSQGAMAKLDEVGSRHAPPATDQPAGGNTARNAAARIVVSQRRPTIEHTVDDMLPAGSKS